MTHEGRMARGKEKISKGITDSETEYYLENKPEEEEEPEPKEKKKTEKKEAKEDAKSTK